jgi:hypothetical protein
MNTISIAQLNRSTSDVTNAANHKETQASLRSWGAFLWGIPTNQCNHGRLNQQVK